MKKHALRLGFDAVGISRVRFLEEEAPRLESWLKAGKNGEMGYMENHFDKRLDPSKLVDGAKSVISLLFNYYPSQSLNRSPKVSKYAWGEDYHLVVKDKLHELLNCLREEIGEIEGRAFVDSAPVLEKAWAKQSGLGWIGKNSNLLVKGKGSFFFLSELIIDLELEPDSPVADYCGTCKACIEACPTKAISPYSVDGSKCISYFTIELKNEIPAQFKGQFADWMFGCDVCMDVCPWNRFSSPNQEERFKPLDFLRNAELKDWLELTEEVFKKEFRNSPLKRSKYNGIKRNIDFLINPAE
ncbi:MAG: tRNA epoxyqueuosine(34) reductase QueG [Bacteroidetes bacterium]|nr:tRNA epoxyqueuosine(34) reductase QueG [Bacteroidota bacterium]